MADRLQGSNHDTDGMGQAKKSMRAYESAWMARWRYTSCETAIEGLSHSSSLKEDPDVSRKLFLPGASEMGTSDSMFAKRSRDVSEFRRIGIMHEDMKESSVKPSSERRNIQPFPMFNFCQQGESIMGLKDAHNTVYNEELQAYPKAETSSRECALKLEKNTLAASSSFQDDMGSSSKVLACGLGSKRPRIRSLIYEHEENALPIPTLEHEENFNSKPFSNFPLHEKRTDDLMDSRRSVKIYTKVGSVQEVSGEPSRFSQTTRHFLITKKTDDNSSEDGQLFRESTVSMKMKEKMRSEFLNLFPSIGFRHQQGRKLQPIESSMDSERPEKNEANNSAVCIRNESSAETDTLDMDNLQKNHLSGMASSSSNKAFKGKQNSSTSQRAEIPGMNQDLPIVTYRESSMDGHKEESSSKTQSMDVEHFLFKELATRRSHIESEVSNRWVKRLKTSALDSTVHGTKSLKMEEALPAEKVYDFFSKIMKCRITGSETQMMKPLGKEPMVSENLVKSPTRQDITLLHPWIQRWCRDKAMSHLMTEPEVVSEAGRYKVTTSDEFQKKQFSSIRAMAFMGKALNGFSSPNLRKRGS